MKEIIIPENFSHSGIFLTLRCNLGCSYCINRQGDFKVGDEMRAEDWIKGLSRIPTREDLPLTICGGEPTVHRDFYEIVSSLQSDRVFVEDKFRDV
jgi:molybdenum cofactor biosynthesis enzyme MoaA